jgi:hypothetical protein
MKVTKDKLSEGQYLFIKEGESEVSYIFKTGDKVKVNSVVGTFNKPLNTDEVLVTDGVEEDRVPLSDLEYYESKFMLQRCSVALNKDRQLEEKYSGVGKYVKYEDVNRLLNFMSNKNKTK